MQAALLTAAVAAGTAADWGPSAIVRFNYTGAAEQWTPPPSAKLLNITVYGAVGGPATNGFTSAPGGSAHIAWRVAEPGKVLSVYVGGAGKKGNFGSHGGGWNGGGDCGSFATSGGGGSDVRTSAAALSDRIVVAGGGGGSPGNGGSAGAGGGVVGGSCQDVPMATCTGSGEGGNATASPAIGGGAFGVGGSCTMMDGSFCTGGGGGWYGGGNGGGGIMGSPGGGGSGYVRPADDSSLGGATRAGVNPGDGYVVVEIYTAGSLCGATLQAVCGAVRLKGVVACTECAGRNTGYLRASKCSNSNISDWCSSK